MTSRDTETKVSSFPTSRKILEVIVKSREEAMEAERGGANRLEIASSLEDGGLTPEIEIVREIAAAVSIPVRVMLRERDAMSIVSEEELRRLQSAARALAALPIEGLVLGFVKDSVIDTDSLGKILSAAPRCSVTFHRAFESVSCPLASLQLLKQFRRIDRVLVRLNGDSGTPRISDLVQWQKLAAPEITLVVGLGLNRENISRLREADNLSEIHVGRFPREPEETWGRLSRNKLIALKSALG